MQISTIELFERLRQIAVDNVRLCTEIAQLLHRRKFEVSEYRRKGLVFLDLQEELNNLLDNAPIFVPIQQARIQEFTIQIQSLIPVKRPNIEDMDLHLNLHHLKLKENMKATQVTLSMRSCLTYN